MTEAKTKVLAALQTHQPASAYTINDACGYADRRMAGKILAALFRRNLATVDDNGDWLLTSKGARKLHGQTHDPLPRTRVYARDDGVIVTMREQETRELNTVHRQGKPEQALREVCALIDGAAGDWRIVTISTPNTIARDLELDPRGDENVDRVYRPEEMMLAKIRRTDLLEPAGLANRSAA